MKKDKRDTEYWRISRMAAHIPEELIVPVDPLGDPSISPSADRIKQLALQKRKDHLKEKEEKPMKKTVFKVVLVAAIVSLLSITAFAAFGGLELIKSIFGDSAASIQNAIVTPQVSASAQGRDMALEALVTDGFVTNMVVSLTGRQPSDDDLFTVTTDTSLRSNGWHVLEDYTTADKTYYAVDFISEQRFDTAEVTLSLNKKVAPIDLSIQIENQLGNAVVDFPAGAMAGQTQLKQLQISPMGFLLIGREENARGGLPSTDIQLVYQNGAADALQVEFDDGDEMVTGGGGAVITDNRENAPLVVMFHGTRNPDKELVVNGQFSRIIDPAQIEKVVIDGVAYPVK